MSSSLVQMGGTPETRRFLLPGWVGVLLLSCLACQGLFAAATNSRKMPVVPKWERFEHEFTSLATYENPLQDVTLQVQFISPLGEKFEIYGFWDGGRSWRVRFAPDQPGRWRFRTICSDAANMGLNDQTGEFLCTSALGQSRFDRHGPVRMASDRSRLEHADGTPFFWLADCVWSGARLADPKSWEVYGVVRASQNFTVAQWAVSPGANFEGRSALTGFPERIGVDPEYFRQLDSKVATLREVGILSAIAPLLEFKPQPEAVALPDDQVALVVRYAVARWGADPVAWVIPAESGPGGAERWRKIGEQVFGGIRHAPVLVFSRQDLTAISDFRDQGWVDLLGYKVVSGSKSSPSGLLGEMPTPRSKGPRQLLVAFPPEENSPGSQPGRRVDAAEVRTGAYCGLLQGPALGISYACRGVTEWDVTVDPKTVDKLGAGLPMWHKSLFLPGAKQMGYLGTLLSGLNFWQLHPEPKMFAPAPDGAGPVQRAWAAATPGKGLALVYSQNERMLELAQDQLPPSPVVTWFNPNRGDTRPAVAVVVQRSCQFPPPDSGDWLLLLKSGK